MFGIGKPTPRISARRFLTQIPVNDPVSSINVSTRVQVSD
jgi:hypothetical protein